MEYVPEKGSKLIECKVLLEVSPNLDKEKYFSSPGIPNVDGVKSVTHCLVTALASNIHFAHQTKLRDSAEHLRHVISELERQFVAQANIKEGEY